MIFCSSNDVINISITYNSVTDAKKQLSAYFEFYNLKRPHSSLDKMTPNEFYYDQLPQQNKVA
ncbi:integrase core domain-containing protein [Acinetobacter soli]